MQKAIHGEEANHPDIADSLYFLANCLQLQGHLEEAKAMHEESLRMQKAIHGEEANHPDIAASLYGLACCLEQQGHLEEAKTMHDKSLRMQAIHGEEVNLSARIFCMQMLVRTIYFLRNKFQNLRHRRQVTLSRQL